MKTKTETGAGNFPAAHIVEKIVAALEQGDIPWKKPWRSCRAHNAVTRHEYTGVNSLLLNLAAHYPDPRFLTYKQAQAMGAQVRKGEKGWPVVFYSTIVKKGEEQKDNGEKEATARRFRFMRYYTVFNACQVDGLPALDESAPVATLTAPADIVQRMPRRPQIADGSRACYNVLADRVEMPPRTAHWNSAEEYHSTLFHELVHATGHESRLNRDLSGQFYGKDGKYAREELVAEIGAQFLCQAAGINVPQVEENAVAYCQGWARALKSDPQSVFYAAAKGQAAHDYILGVARNATSEGES
jgi:antirestriction protein ArdC